jgi:energy-coupling factor transporter ATP-binding protein EcfA2
MTFLEIYKHIEDKHQVDIVCIQGNKETFYCYGKKANHLANDLKLKESSGDIKSVKFPSSQLEKCEDHFKNYAYNYIILELFESVKESQFNEKRYVVTRSSCPDALGANFDNKNSTGQYPRKKQSSLDQTLEIAFSAGDSGAVESKNITLNEEQASVLSKINDWISSDNSVAIISGRAGTGKTTLLKFVVKLLEKRKKTFSLLAPTGRAARILSRKTGLEAHTIHKEIYVLDPDAIKMSEDHDQQQQAFEESDFSIQFKIKAEENLSQIYIIDESSMIGDKKGSESDLNFGTGRLLSDLLTQTGVIHRKNVNTKLLFVGDYAQLPPIREDSSPALNKEYLFNKFKLKSVPEYFELITVMRQAKNSLILNNAEMIRTHIDEKDFSPLNIKIDSKQVLTTTPSKAQDKAQGSEIENSIMVTRSNKTAYHYNQSFRSRKFLKREIDNIQQGDLIIVTNNSPKYGCYNGDIYKVINVSANEARQVKLEKSNQYREKPQLVNLFYRDVIVRPVEYIDDIKHDKSIKIIENLLNKPEAFLEKKESIASHVDWNNRIRDKNLTVEEKRMELLNDSYLNAVQVKYAYAITCHKAQGGEWQHVCIFLEGISQDESYYRWLYTAVTRATTSLSFINLPKAFEETA